MKVSLVAASLLLFTACSQASPQSTATPTMVANTSSTTVSEVSIPDWASAFDNAEKYLEFLTAIRNHLDERGIEYELNLKTGAVLLPGDASLGLENLAQRVAAATDGERQVSITEHFDAVIALVDDPPGEGILRIRMWPDAYEIDFSCAHIGDVHLVPVFDFPDSIRSINQDEINERQVQPDTYCETALADTLTHLGEAIQTTELEIEGVSFFSLEYPFYASTAALDPSLFVDLPTDGAVVFIPVAHAALVLPLTGTEIAPALSALSSITDQWYADGPNSLSLSPFWWSEATGLVPLPDPRFDALFG